MTPVRVMWGNLINCAATTIAIQRYAWSKATKRPLRWLKTEHAYPTRVALVEHWRKIGEILVGSCYVSQDDLDYALANKPGGVRTGEWLVSHGKLTFEDLYEALALQQNLPLGKPERRSIAVEVTRALPAKISRQLSVLPFRVVAHQLYIASSEVPDERITRRIQDFCPLEVRFHLVTPADFEELSAEYIPVR